MTRMRTSKKSDATEKAKKFAERSRERDLSNPDLEKISGGKKATRKKVTR